MTKPSQALWFRQDLRTHDNPALVNALKAGPTVAFYAITPKSWQQHDKADIQVAFILRQLEDLKARLDSLNVPLKIIEADTFAKLPKTIESFCGKHEIENLHAQKLVYVDERDCDAVLEDGVLTCHWVDSYSLIEPDAISNQAGDPFKVFTPFKKAWWNVLNERGLQVLKKPSAQDKLSIKSDAIPKSIKGFKTDFDLSDWPATEADAIKRLKAFCKKPIESYKAERDYPSLNSTSVLSPYFTQGVISPAQAFAVIEAWHGLQNHQVETWLSEVIWREFYQMIAFRFDSVCKNQPFKPETNALPWSQNEEHFQAWCDGQTGFPLVDAAMRQLKQTGWMHNRLRMVVAMFLTKTLFIHWRKGEQHFMRHLIDGEFGANNGGWQWSASTGTDAAPYFRIFNPTTQSERFDKSGDFIREYCPELANLDSKHIHNPSDEQRMACDYPFPVVDYSAMRQHVIAEFKALKKDD